MACIIKLFYIQIHKGNKYVDATSDYFFARVYALSNEFDKTLLNLEKAVKRGISKTQIERMYDLDGFRESNLHIVYAINYDKWHNEYLATGESRGLNSNYIKQLNAINSSYKQVKAKRVGEELIFEVNDSVNQIYDYEELKSFNFEKTLNLILLNGYPTNKRVGNSFNTISYRFWYGMPDNFT